MDEVLRWKPYSLLSLYGINTLYFCVSEDAAANANVVEYTLKIKVNASLLLIEFRGRAPIKNIKTHSFWAKHLHRS